MRRIQGLLAEALGTNLVDEIEPAERIRHVRATATICIVCGIAFSAFNLMNPATQLLGFAEAASLVFFFIPSMLLLGRPQQIDASEMLLLLGALFISSSLIVLGGVEGTGLLWVYSVPFLTFFIKGQRKGWHYALVFFGVHIVCMAVIGPQLSFAYPYPPDVRVHFLLSMAFYVLVASAFSLARSRFETDLHHRRAEAEAASRAKSRFLASASHDLRQPAHALGLFVARLKQLPHDAQTRELVAGVDASVHALQEMLDAFFDYSRLDSQLTHANPRSFDLNSVFDKLRTSFADTAHNKGLRLRIRPTRVWVRSDPVLLHRVLLNLLSNAVQHTPAGSVHLACRCSAEAGWVRIQVRDSGIGIAPDQQKKVFEEFYQVENPERDRSKGLGLGLSIVERSCKLLSHRISLRSDLGCGSTFTLLVPMGEPEPQLRKAQGAEAFMGPDLSGMRIMLIEDDPLGRGALSGLLASWGCTVLEASTAQEALDQWRIEDQPHFILTDFRLLGALNGVEAVQRLREKAGTEVAACVISGDGDAGVRNRTSSAGLLLLQKPVKPGKLRNVLRHAWSTQQA